jgi:hypothetical protein
MKTLITCLTVAALSVQIAGCAAMFHGTSDQITIQSPDADAQIYMDSVLIGKGAANAYVKRSTTHTLSVKKSGCADHSVETQKSFDAVSLLGVLVDFGVISMLVVDWGLTGAMWKTDPLVYHLAPICDISRTVKAAESNANAPVSAVNKPGPSLETARGMVTISHPPDGYHTSQDHISLLGVARGGPLKEVDITTNGRRLRGITASGGTDKTKPLNITVPLEEGENVIAVTVYDTAGDIVQEVRTVYRDAVPEQKLPGGRSTDKDAGERWAIVIGIDQYSDPAIPPLSYAEADARAMHSFLTTEGGVKPDHAVLLLNKDANQRKLRQTLGEYLRRKALKQDEVIIYYAGHGTTEPLSDDTVSSYLVPWDADPDSLFSTAIPMEEVKQILNRLSARKVLILQDTCYSGNSGGRTFIGKYGGVRAGSISSKFLQELSQKQGRLIITASDANEPSVEDGTRGHGVFTYFLLQGLKGEGDLDKDGAIRARELHTYLDRRVHEHSGGNQTPQIYGDGDMVLIQR